MSPALGRTGEGRAAPGPRKVIWGAGRSPLGRVRWPMRVSTKLNALAPPAGKDATGSCRLVTTCPPSARIIHRAGSSTSWRQVEAGLSGSWASFCCACQPRVAPGLRELPRRQLFRYRAMGLGHDCSPPLGAYLVGGIGNLPGTMGRPRAASGSVARRQPRRARPLRQGSGPCAARR